MTSRSQGLKAWLFQRLTAVYLAIFILYVASHFFIDPPASHADWQNWIGRPVMSVMTMIFFAALLVHAWVGVRDVIIDYVNAFAARFMLLAVLGLTLTGFGFWVIRILLAGAA